MLGAVFTGIKRFILWDYPRASWQYDVMVGLILGFLFLTPREWFRDRPRVPRASQIAQLQANEGTKVFWIESELLAGVAPERQTEAAAEKLKELTGERAHVRLEPVFDSEKEIKGYLAFTRP